MGIVCKIAGHKRDRDKVWDDGLNYRSNCRWCHAPMIKAEPRGWRLFDRQADFDLRRKGKPTH